MSNSEEKEIEFISKFSENKEYYKNLLQNSKKIPEIINERKEKIKNIDLLENTKNNLYEWKNLFSPISIKKYTKLKIKTEQKKNLLLKKSNSEKKHILKKDNFQFPIALIDLPEEKIENIIPNYKKIDDLNTSKSNIIRPSSVYTRPNKNDIFYLSKDFSDYYIQDFQTFVKKVPILQPKKRCKSAKLKKEILNNKNIEKKIENKINNMKINSNQNLTIVNQYLTLAMKSNNVQPLLSNIYKQIHPNKKDILIKKEKYYKNTDKPLGNDYGNVNYNFNNRYGHYLLLKQIKLNESYLKEKNELEQYFVPLNLDTYDINDPSLKIFKDIEDSENIINYNNQNFEKKNKTINIHQYNKPIVLFDKVLHSNNNIKNNIFRLQRPLSVKKNRIIINNKSYLN